MSRHRLADVCAPAAKSLALLLPAAGMCKRQEAAHISLPAMLRPLGLGEAPGSGVGSDGTGAGGGGGGGGLLLPSLVANGLGSLAEEEEEEEEEGEEEAGEGQQQQPQAHERQQQQQPPHLAQFQQQQPAHTQQQQQAEQQQQQQASDGGWVWRTPLELSAPHWEGWYLGLSDQFLKLSVPKVKSIRPAKMQTSRHACSQHCHAAVNTLTFLCV
jgi:hypothetical protein